MQSYWSALQFAPTNLPVSYRGTPQASHGIIAANFIIVEQWRFQKRRYDNTRAVKTMNTSSSKIFRYLTRESEMWFTQALRRVFHENVRQEVFEMSCFWFLDVF